LRRRRFRLLKTHSKRVDTDPQGSKHGGVFGFYETFLRKFKIFTQLVTLLPLYIIASACVGLSLVASVYAYELITEFGNQFPHPVQIFLTGFAIGLGYFLYGFSLLIVVPVFNFLFRAYPVPHRGPYFSVEFLSWYIHNGLTYLVRYTFIEFITPTPLNLFFFRAMGMKIGRNSQINSSNISDPALIELGDRVTVGGSATITAHYGQQGFLVLSPTKIGNNVTLGMKCTIMGGVTIGNDVKILPNSVVLPKTTIPNGEIWGGVPAVKIA
jgi:acetyltransferase-like isoleucine patch superfamily enzyme